MDYDHEVDSTVIFKQEADQLTTVLDLSDALSRFGYSKDDRISRRELVLIYTKIQHEMELEIFRLANSSFYSEAKEMRSRLTNLRSEFDNLQLSGVENLRKDQTVYFEKASEYLGKDLVKKQEVATEELSSSLVEQKNSEEFFHTIQNDNLDQTISKIPRPKMRYSKRMIELFRAEYGLNKLKEYDEAIKVRRMIDKLLPKEEKKFYDHFEKTIEAKRVTLAKIHADDNARLEEKQRKIEWNHIRQKEYEANLLTQRIKNHAKDMNHAHTMEAKLKPEMSVKPSALWQKREHFQTTASSLRGLQLLDHARGKKSGEAVYADSLVTRHDFFAAPSDTLNFDHSEYERTYK